MKAIRNVTLFSLSIVALALFAAAPAAYADSATYTATLGNGSTTIGTPFGLTLTPTITQWNDPGYTLQSVFISFSGNGGSTITVTNNSGSSGSFNYSDSVGVTMTGVGTISGIGSLMDTASGGLPFTPLAAGATYGPSSITLVGGLTPHETYTDAPTLALFTGLGTVDFGVTSPASGDLAGFNTTGGNWDTRQTTVAGGTVTVTYDYSNTITPEPGTLTLFGTGLLGLAGMLRRKFMQAR
jgi:hypothetical protein